LRDLIRCTKVTESRNLSKYYVRRTVSKKTKEEKKFTDLKMGTK
jgi:hypothetical protein